MTTMTESVARKELVGRREHLLRVRSIGPPDDIRLLLDEVDAALARLDQGTFGICEVCREDVEPEVIAADPLARCCAVHPTRHETTRIDADLALARRVQLSLLPSQDLAVPGWRYAYRYEPAREVGGDFCDVLPVPARRETIVLVGDVAGKGVAASMLMTSLLATFRSLAPLGLPAGDLLARANDLFHAASPPAAYATLAAAVLGPEGAVDLYSAGHWPPVVRRNGTPETIDLPAGLPLGLFAGSRYESTRLGLDPGDLLFFFTDGAVEAENGLGEPLGSAGLARMLAASAIRGVRTAVETTLGGLRRFVGPAPLEDDLTLFAIARAAPGR